ncbi:branched-chain amino acid ABC transporter permease [Micromonospora sp. WMMD710]|uniref:branched-chain amino acid ABC transporter permease n=1 Tax=Micromonospora sp. WMMD710 TaxID=3016085 RepID=UPI002417C001|nr:branched-chain amino acid ABC transporter permease [Micromonospora sp. WMMD710]MDG4758244.1 branched-chain amino acid ABC transporter permease [Micromonospora sp. WMMD710]
MNMLLRTSPLGRVLLTALAALLVLIASQVLDPFRNFQFATIAAYLCATAGLTVLTGLNGQLSLGHGALMASGAYTVALIQDAFGGRQLAAGWILVATLLGALAVGVAAGAVIGLAAARLQGPHLAGLTLGVAVIVPSLATTFDALFGGEQGLPVQAAQPPLALGATIPYERWQVWLAWTITLPTILLLTNLVHSRLGRDMRAVRDHEVAASLSGIDVARTRVVTFTVSAGCAALGGALLAVLTQVASPGSYPLTLSVFLLMAVVIGGLDSLTGAIWGALLLVALPDLAQSVTGLFSFPPGEAQRWEGNLPTAAFGLMLITVMAVAPTGVSGLQRRVVRAAAERWRARRPNPRVETP